MGVHEAAKLLFIIGGVCGIAGCVPPMPNWLWGVGILVIGVAGVIATP